MDGILNDEMSRMLANQLDFYASREHQEKINALIAEQELMFAKTYGLIPYKDGNQWCVLLGANIQEGICGFGDTPLHAIYDFNKAFQKN